MFPKRALSPLFALFGLLVAPLAPASESSPITIVVFPFELVDTSLQGELEGKSERDLQNLEAAGARVRELLEESPRYRVVGTEAAARIFQESQGQFHRFYKCKSCSLKAARELGADRVLVGWVQKVSNLILNLTIRVQDSDSGDVVAGGWTSLRGNTEAMWRRSAERLVADKLFPEAQE